MRRAVLAPLLAALLVGGATAAQPRAAQPAAPVLAPYVPTPQEVVDRMLTLAKVTRNDVVVDLGCGDGRIPITAARVYGTRGVDYIGGLSKGQNLHQYFKYLDIIDKLKMKRLDIGAFDKISFDDDPVEYNYAQGYDLFKETLISYFPGEKGAINKYCEALQNIVEHFPLYRLREGEEHEFFSKNLNVGAKPCIDSLTENLKLRSVLSGNNLLYAGVPG